MTEFPEVCKLRHPLRLCRTCSCKRDRARVGVDHLVDDLVDAIQGGLTFRRFRLISESFTVVLRQFLIRSGLIGSGEIEISRWCVATVRVDLCGCDEGLDRNLRVGLQGIEPKCVV